jgi:AraC-type DNA-binding domain-containing proteins
MQPIESFPDYYRQNRHLPIRLIAPGFGHLPPDVIKSYGLTHRKTYYFFVFMLNGVTTHHVDLEQFDVSSNELLFILPHQIHGLPVTKQGTDYYKLGFDEECLARLPKQYPFLINPLNRQKIRFAQPEADRLKAVFSLLRDLLATMDADADLILAHLNSLLTEINAAYFCAGNNPADGRLSKYILFKRFVEENLTEQPTVSDIAKYLSLNSNSLYNIVRHYSGLSPKGFIINRLILEAKRRLCYAESASVKELAYQLGFNDPEYFSRLFKKVTGKTIPSFVQDLSGK